MKMRGKRIWIEMAILMAILMAITLFIDVALFAYHTPFWAACLVTVAIFGGGDSYYHIAQGGHDNE